MFSRPPLFISVLQIVILHSSTHTDFQMRFTPDTIQTTTHFHIYAFQLYSAGYESDALPTALRCPVFHSTLA